MLKNNEKVAASLPQADYDLLHYNRNNLMCNVRLPLKIKMAGGGINSGPGTTTSEQASERHSQQTQTQASSSDPDPNPDPDPDLAPCLDEKKETNYY